MGRKNRSQTLNRQINVFSGNAMFIDDILIPCTSDNLPVSVLVILGVLKKTLGQQKENETSLCTGTAQQPGCFRLSQGE